jgi:hypothetical protein
MLALPDNGFCRSVEEHNVPLDAICDWIEGSILFDSDAVSTTDVIDVLIEEEIYADDDFASQIVETAWAEMQRRSAWVNGAVPFRIGHRRIERLLPWEDFPGHSFCVTLALAECYPEWAKVFGSNYTQQGELFELLTKESLEHQFPGWQIHQTGWTRSRTVRLAQVVEDVASRLGEATGHMNLWTNPNAKEKGLDLLVYRPFEDKRVGIPVYLMQCASGRNWETKLKTPDIAIWRNVIRFTVEPKRAFSAPFALLDDDFERTCVVVEGMVLDRYRLLAASGRGADWVSPSLKDRIINWARPRIAALPRAD